MLNQNQENNLQQNNLQPIKSSGSVGVMVGIICVLASLLIYMFYLKSLNGDVEKFEDDLVLAETNVLKLEQEIEAYRNTEAQLNITSDVAKELALAAIPSKLEQDEVIRDLVEIARANDIEFNSVSFSKASSAYAGVKSLKLSASFEGNYTDLISFLRGLEINERYFRVNSISVQVNTSDEIGLTRIAFSLSFEAYFQ